MRKENIGNKTCYIYGGEAPQAVLIQPCDDRELESVHQEYELIAKDSAVALIAFKVDDWNCDLCPWTAPPVFGKEPFGDNADKTLAFITEGLVPYIRAKISGSAGVMLGGYSLAGLFSLWSAYQTDIFAGVAAVSPSVWFDGWMDFARAGEIKTDYVYLSLGDKEHKTRNERMKTIADRIREQFEILREKNVETVLEWNEGNHFQNVGIRTAKGFRWLVEKCNYSCG